MANSGTFNKSNWSRLSGDPKAVVYLPQSQSKGIVAQTLSANATVVLTFNVPFQFKGNGPVEVSFPFGQTFQNSTGNPALSEAWLTQGASPYSAKVNPIVNVKLSNVGTAAATLTSGTDLLVTQF